MKRLTCLSLLLALWLPGLLAQSLTLINHSPDSVRLRLEVMQTVSSYSPSDSLVVAPGETRVLSRKEPYVSFYRVMQVDNPRKFYIEYIWDEDVTVTLDSALGMQVTGSARTTAFQEYTQEVVDPARKILIANTVESTRLRQQGDSLGAETVHEKSSQLIRSINQQFYQLSHAGPKDFLYLYWLAREWTVLGIPATKKLLDEFSPEWQRHPFYVDIADDIQKIESVGEGVRMESFTRTTLAGTPLQLSGLASEYILLDFWGSWCGPCIQAIPKLKKLGTTFPADKLTIIGIAGETALPSSALRKTIEKHTIYWPQIEELRTDPESLINRFHITFFPTYILLDKNLVIVKRGGPEVLEDIVELLRK